MLSFKPNKPNSIRSYCFCLQVLELQNTLEDLSSRVDNVKEENLRLRSENQVEIIEYEDDDDVADELPVPGAGAVH